MFSKNKTKKVYIGLSGGVDSAVSAYILKKQGYDVTGVFIKTWQPDWMKCTSQQDRREAMRVAAHLGIAFETLDLSAEYKKYVADYMIGEYIAGRTPNPDIMCNKTIKFGSFAHYAFRQGADYIATGHYARIVFNAKNNEYNLLKAIDSNKDQSYFLYAINKEHLSKILFPIGDLTKPEVRKIAKKIKLPNALRKDSQGICFLGMIDMQEFLSHYISTKQGDVLDAEGNTIGHHPGSIFFTIGERHGFTITKKGNNDSPLFVIHKDNDKNTITVDDKVKLGHEDTDNSKLSIAKTNWLSNNLRINNVYDIRLRYRQEMMKGSIVNRENDNAVINISRLSESYASGQSLVVYDGDVCLGGGIID